MCGGGGGRGDGGLAARIASQQAEQERARQAEAAAAAERARQAEEAARQAEIARREANRNSSRSALADAFGFANDDFYGGIRNQYRAQAGGQLENEYGQLASDLNRIIGRSGQGTRQEGIKARSGLSAERAAALGSVEETGQRYADQARRNIDAARGDFMSRLESGDADLSGEIRQRAGALAAMPQFDVPGSFLGDANNRRQDWAKTLFSGKDRVGAVNPLFGTGSQTIVNG